MEQNSIGCCVDGRGSGTPGTRGTFLLSTPTVLLLRDTLLPQESGVFVVVDKCKYTTFITTMVSVLSPEVVPTLIRIRIRIRVRIRILT